MALSMFKRSFKIVIFVLFFAFIGNTLMSVSDTSAATLPDILTRPPAWRASGQGFFYGVQSQGTDANGAAVIKGGIPIITTYQVTAPLAGTDGIVTDPAGSRFSDMIGALLRGETGTPSYDQIGAAYIVFSFLNLSGESAGSNPIDAAIAQFPTFKARVDAYFDAGLVARYVFSGSGVYNTYHQAARDDIAWYKDSSEIGTSTLIFLDENNPNDYTKAVYVIKAKCANPLGGHGAPPPPSRPTSASCSSLPNSAYTMRYGGTQAQSAVVNMSKKDNAWKKTDGATSTPAVVWARPGDSVRFSHTLCFGAQNVRGTDRIWGQDNAPTDNSKKPTTQNWFQISASSVPGGGNYLFGDTVEGSRVTLGRGQGRPSVKADKVEDYGITLYSPGDTAKETYKCYPGASFPEFVANGYQIPDFASTMVPANCNSAKKSGSASDAGKVITQNLAWNNVKAWQNTHHLGIVGDCGCPDDSLEDIRGNNTVHNYDYAVANSSTFSKDAQCVPTSGRCGWCDTLTVSAAQTATYYPITDNGGPAGATQVAQVKIPYNYNTSTTVATVGEPNIFPGGDLPVTVTVGITKRTPNPEVADNDYATISKNSKYQVIAFTVDPTRGAGSLTHAGTKYEWSKNTVNICNSVHESNCRIVDKGDRIFNEGGNLAGGTDNVFSGSLGIPDAEVGTKFCIAVGVWPSDSHNFGSEPGGIGNTALKNDDGAFWNYSEPNCRTITKKPTVQFRSAGVYTTGGITTSQTRKTVGYDIGRTNGYSELESRNVRYGSDTPGSRRVFGSFVEYEAIAKKNVKGFASGAAFGYNMNNNGVLSGNALPGGYVNVAYSSEPVVCTFSTQSFSNDQCNNGTNGAVGLSQINSFGDTILRRLLSRYTSQGGDPTQGAGAVNFSNYMKLDNGTRYIKVRGNVSSTARYCATKGTTLVVDVSGTLKITNDIIYGAGCTEERYKGAAELPQVIMVAGDIEIAGNVKQIDAWLVVGQNGTGNGEIKTCSDVAGTIGKLSRSGGQEVIQVGANHCVNQLRVNGPVYAKKLVLNRNAGAGQDPITNTTGSAGWRPIEYSVAAGEIFNLRPDTYLWAYNQASRYSQAVTTYQQELAPRY